MKNAALAVPEIFPSRKDIFQNQDFADTQAVIVAVSGGSDSTALLLFTQEFLAQMENPPRLVAVTIDHGLRPDSGIEAQKVARFCASRAIVHEIICWKGEGKPETVSQARARAARYHLLHARALLHGARVIFAGHTLDDQAETYLMRAARLSGRMQVVPRGLAAMARESLLFGDVRLIRPFLTVRRAELRYFLEKQSVHWIDDPSNENRRFERVRLRQVTDKATILAAVTAVRQAENQRNCYNERVMRWIKQCQPCRMGEMYQLDLSRLPVDDVFLPQFIADFACLVGGARYLRPAPSQLLSLLQKDAAMRFNWAGCVVERRRSWLRLWRERRNLAKIIVPAKTVSIWDQRYQIANNSDEEIMICPLLENRAGAFFEKEGDDFAQKNATGRESKAIESINQNKNCSGYKVNPLAYGLDVPLVTLAGTPSIVSKKGIDLPILSKGFIHNDCLSLNRIMAPFHFLYREAERDLVAHWGQIFNLAL